MSSQFGITLRIQSALLADPHVPQIHDISSRVTPRLAPVGFSNTYRVPQYGALAISLPQLLWVSAQVST